LYNIVVVKIIKVMTNICYSHKPCGIIESYGSGA
jgi:hypothetical protein